MKRTRLLTAIAGMARPNIVLVGRSIDGQQAGKSGIVIRQHDCPSCKTTATINNINTPSCPTCDGIMAPKKSADTLTLKRPELQNMPVAAFCRSCKTEFVSTKECLSHVKGITANCVVCGEGLKITAEMGDDDEADTPADEGMGATDPFDNADDDGFTEESDGEGESDGEDDASVTAGDDSDFDTGDDEGDGELSGDDDGEIPTDDDMAESDDAAADADEGDDSDEDDAGDEAIASDIPGDEPPADAPTPEKKEGEDEAAPEEKPEDKPEGEAAPAENTIQANALKMVLSSLDENPEIEFVANTLENGDTRYHMFANGVPCARADKARAKPEIAALFNDRTRYHAALSTALAAAPDANDPSTPEQKLADFGFEPTIVDVPTDEATKQHIEKEVAARTATTAGDITAVSNRFKTCMSIASLAVRKGIGGVKSPVRAAFIQMLKQHGFRNAASTVDGIYEKHGEEELSTVLGLARDYVLKSDESLNDISNIVEKTAAPASSDDEKESAPTPAPITVAALGTDKPFETASSHSAPNQNGLTAKGVVTSMIGRRTTRMGG